MRLFIIIMFFLSASGCAPLSTGAVSPSAADKPLSASKEEASQETVSSSSTQEMILEGKDAAPALENVEDKKVKEYIEKKGIIFAKTDFGGILQKSFVKLIFENQDDPGKKFQLYIGDKEQQAAFPWDVKTVEPGYFYIELPEGRYRVSRIAIPIGSTMAAEQTNVYFSVVPNAIVYIGTLKVNGTKEKIKLGGLPVIKPGFEYDLEILDEYQSGVEQFRKQYPNIQEPIEKKMMVVEEPLQE